MAKPATTRKRGGVKPGPKLKSQAHIRRPSRPPGQFKRNVWLTLLEVFGLLVVVTLAIIVLLGYSSIWFSGTRLLTSLLPFAAGILGLVVLSAGFLVLWWKLSRFCRDRMAVLPALLSVSLAVLTAWTVTRGEFALAYSHFRTLVGGKQEARRMTLAHQVYAAYRRYDTRQLQRLIQRGQTYKADIEAAAKAFDIDADLLQGVAAAESSFIPRSSRDGGYGLFQITRTPKAAMTQARKYLAVDKPSVRINRHNTFIAAATLRHYLQEMNGDLFLGLLAYNIGPANGGLRFIMQKYGASDFVTIQPYLQKWPRDYPIRVLSFALAFRIWQQTGKLLAYEQADNAVRIQRMGIPGLLREF